MQDDGNIEKLNAINGIGNKTVDYLRILSGVSTAAVDRHILSFLKKAGIEIRLVEYERAKSIVNETANQIDIDPSILDHSIWLYMSKKSGQQQSQENGEVLNSLKSIRHKDDNINYEIGPYSMNEIFLCSADAGPSSQRPNGTVMKKCISFKIDNMI